MNSNNYRMMYNKKMTMNPNINNYGILYNQKIWLWILIWIISKNNVNQNVNNQNNNSSQINCEGDPDFMNIIFNNQSQINNI